DLDKNVEYLCYHTGVVHHADHVFQDFKDKFARYLDDSTADSTVVGAEGVYRACLVTSLVDGAIGQEERIYLQSLVARLGISDTRASELEQTVRGEISQSVERAPSDAINISVTESITTVVERQ